MTHYLRQVKVEIESSDRTVLIVEQLRVVFDLRSEKQSSTSPSTVKIYNLGRASASHIAERGQVVRVTATSATRTLSSRVRYGESCTSEAAWTVSRR